MFKFLILFLLVLIFVPQVRQFFFWLLVGRQITKEQKRMNDIFEAQMKSQNKTGETKGGPTVKPAKKPSNDGEYIDYKEL